MTHPKDDPKRVTQLTLLGKEAIYAAPGRLPKLSPEGCPLYGPRACVLYEPGGTPWFVYTAHRGSPIARRPNLYYIGEFRADDTVFEVYVEELWFT